VGHELKWVALPGASILHLFTVQESIVAHRVNATGGLNPVQTSLRALRCAPTAEATVMGVWFEVSVRFASRSSIGPVALSSWLLLL